MHVAARARASRAPLPQQGRRRLLPSIETLLDIHRAGGARPPAGLEWPASIHASARFVFDRPGVYRIRTRIDDAVSNVIVVDAVMPTGEDARLLAALRERPAVLGFYGAAEDEVRAAGERLLAEFGPRPLLQPFVRRRSLDPRTTPR